MTDDRKYIYVKGEKIYVSDEIYKAYKKQVNHEAYLNKSDKKHKVYGYEDYKIDLNSIVDEDVDIGKIVETKMRIKDLYQALRKLNVIDSLYFKKMTIRDLAKEQQVSSKKIFSFRNKILKKLREILK